MNLEQIAPIVEQIIKDTLQERRYPFGNTIKGIGNKIASGRLRDSITVNAVQNGNEQTLEITGAAYGNFVDLGRVAGRKDVPISAIMQWIGEKGIGIRNEKGQFVKGHSSFKKQYKNAKETGGILNLAFAIQKNIQKFGIRNYGEAGQGFIAASLQNLQNNRNLMSLLEETSLNELKSIIDKNFNTIE